MSFAKFLILVVAVASVSVAYAADTNDQLAEQVRRAERAFAKTMADRDVKAFASFLAEDAVFFGASALRGKDAVVAGWRGFYESASPPFSWSPETVVVIESGTLAYSSGPVLDPKGKQIATFNSVWRREANGEWKVVFDKGCDACACQ